MALITCPECGRENVSDTAIACPSCGYCIKEHFELEKNINNKVEIETENDYIIGEAELKKKDKNRESLNLFFKNNKKLFGLLGVAVVVVVCTLLFINRNSILMEKKWNTIQKDRFVESYEDELKSTLKRETYLSISEVLLSTSKVTSKSTKESWICLDADVFSYDDNWIYVYDSIVPFNNELKNIRSKIADKYFKGDESKIKIRGIITYDGQHQFFIKDNEVYQRDSYEDELFKVNSIDLQ